MEDIILVLLFYFIATVLSNKKQRGKVPSKRPVPMPRQGGGNGKPVDFEIPRLEGAPPRPSSDGIYQEDAEGEETWQHSEEPDRGYASQDSLAGAGNHEEPGKKASPHAQGDQPTMALTPQTALQAVAWAEILNQPKAHRNRTRAWKR